MDIRPIKTEEDYNAALERVDALMDAEENTPEGDELDILVTLITAHEAKHYPIPDADPVDMIKHLMTANGLKQVDFAKLIGSAPRASEILRRKRDIPKSAMWTLHTIWGIPAESLIRPKDRLFKG
jgi:HTH-type transcriptional regulator/antitoxin HigA